MIILLIINNPNTTFILDEITEILKYEKVS